jgi:hypothetical protein
MNMADLPEHPYVSEVRESLELCRGHWGRVASRSGVSYSWLSQFARGLITNPTINQLQVVKSACDAVIDEPITIIGHKSSKGFSH